MSGLTPELSGGTGPEVGSGAAVLSSLVELGVGDSVV